MSFIAISLHLIYHPNLVSVFFYFIKSDLLFLIFRARSRSVNMLNSFHIDISLQKFISVNYRKKKKKNGINQKSWSNGFLKLIFLIVKIINNFVLKFFELGPTLM